MAAASSKSVATRTAAGSSDEDDYHVVATTRSGGTSSTSAPVAARAAGTRSISSAAGVKLSAPSDDQAPAKKPKLAPIFQRQAKPSSSTASSPITWSILDERGKGTCFQGMFQDPFAAALKRVKESREPKGSVTFACFDLDGTLVTPKGGRSWPSANDEYDYQPVFRDVFAKVKDEYDKGSVIVIVSNQKQRDPVDLRGAKIPKLETWKKKLALICSVVGAPCAIYAACGSDKYRKPATGMWGAALEAWAKAGGRPEDVAVGSNVAEGARCSFYVGDAAGRSGDHSDTDRKWALNLDLPFYTPEAYFLGRPDDGKKWKLRGYRPELGLGVSTTATGEEEVEYEPSSPPLVSAKPEVVLFVGPPAAGKTSFYRRHFQSAGYEWVNQDTLKTRPKCLAAVARAIEEGRSAVVDNTNRDESTRKGYIELAKAKGWGVRAVWFDLKEDVLEHNNHYRAKGGAPHEPPRELIPTLAFQSYFKALEPPTTLEGLDEVKVVRHLVFRGDDEARQRYAKWWA